MKKKLLLSLMGSVLLSFLTFSTIGQSYVATYNTDAGYPGTLNTEGNTTTTGWNEILAASLGANQWSSAEAIPFPFDFYGSPVTHFIASGNGLVTFDTTVIGNTPPNANVALPDPGVPDKTIACFWDEFTGSPPTGSNDRVYTKEFGTAPNRQLWIRWFSYEWGPTGDFNYVSVVLEETSNKIYIVDVYNSSSLVGGTTTVGIQVDNGTAFTEGNTISLAGNGFATGDEDYYEYTFFAAGACLPPTNLATANITSNSADVSWTTGGAANWQVQYGPAGFTPGSGTFAGTSSNPYTITGLSANTNYDVYVRDSCGVGDVSAWAGPVSFTTLCTSQLSGSYTINSALPTGGTNFASFADALLELNGCGVSGAVTFSISAGTYTENIYLGNITGSSSSNTVTFDGGSAANVTITYSSSNDTATVYLSGTGYVTFTNMTIANTSTSDGWGVMLQNSSNNINITNCVIDMPVTSTTDIIGIVASNDNSFETSTGDNTNFLTVSGCTFNGGETGIHLTGGSSSATANTGNKIMNNVFRQQDDHAIEVDGQVNLTVSGNDIDNLVSSFADAIYLEDVDDFTVTANTVISPDWGLYVIDGNDGTGTTTRSLVANNMIISNTDYPIYLNDVEQVDVFHNSTFGEPAFAINDQDNVDIRNNVFVSTNDHAFYSLDPLTANDVVDYNVYNTGATVGFDIGPNDYNTLSDWQTAEASYNVNSLEGDPVFVGPTDLHLVGTIADNAGVPLASVTADIDGDVRSGTTPDIGADEYSAPSCSPSTALTASNITSTSVDLSWTAGGGTSFNLEYGPSGFGSGNGTVVNGVANPYTLSGLNPQTTYDFYIQDDCGAGGTSPWSGPVSFTTLCAPLTSFPWTEDFETSQNSIPACWENETNDDEDWIFRSGSIGHGATTDNTTGTAAGYYAGVDDSQSSANDTVNNLLTPSFDLTSLVAPRLNFHYFIGNDNILTSKLVIDVYDGTTWNMGVATINFTQAAWLPYTLDLTAYKSANSRIRFRGVETTDFNSDISIDDVIVEETPSCAAPTALGATNITDVSADLYWTGGGAANWNIEYGPTGFSLGAGTAVNATNDTTNISGLMAGTTYDFYVRDSCGVGDVSAWVGPFSFNTALCPPADQCTYTFDLGDTFGDGWNGNEIGVMQNGVMVATGLGAGFTTGSTFQETVALCDSVMAYVVVTNDGAFNAECFLDVSDPFGATAASYASGSQFDLGDTLASFLVVCTPPSCPDPLSLGITNNGDVSTDLYWTDPVGSVSAWEVEYGPTGFTQGTGTLLNATNDTATASALTASTTYDFYVRSDCGGGLYSAWIGPFTWTTQPCSVNDQCNYVFDLGDTFGDGWNGNEIGVMQNGVMVATGLGAGFTTGSTFQETVALCDSVMAYVVVTNDGAFNAECFLDVSDPFGVNAASYASGSQFDLGDTLASFFVVCTPPACPDPLSLGITNNGDVSTDLYWTDPVGSVSAWEVEYGPTGFTQGTGTLLNATNDTATASALTASTTYDFYVRSDCGGGLYSAWVGPFTWTTQPCSVNDQCSYVFDLGDTFGDGWNGNEIGVMQNGVMVATSLGNGFTTGSTFGPLSVALCDSIMAYVVVTVDGAFNGECFFDVTDPFGVAAASFPSGSQFDLGDTLASFFVSCTPPACADPTNLAVNSVTSTTANLSWNDFGTGTDWTVEYGPVGFTQGTGTITTATTTSVNISGLMPNTTYDFYVRANCGGPVSAWVGPFTFTTACTPFVAPYTENFDGNTWVSSTSFNGVGDTIDNCWDRNNDPNLYSWTVRGPGTVSFTTGPAGDRNGTGKYVMIEGSNGSSGNVAELYTPLVDVSALVRPELAFFFHTNVNPGDSIFVDIQDSAGVWNNKVVAIGQLQTAQTDAYEKATVDLSPYGDTVQARFRSVKSTFFNGDMAIDDISFDNAPLCPEPSLVSITGVTSSAVFFGFNSSNTSFNFEVGPVGFTQGTGTVSSGGNPGTVGGLMPNTTYDLYIQTDCSGNGNGTSSWIGPFTFTTLCAPLVAPYYEDFSSFTIGFFNGIENCVTIESDNPGTTPSGGYSWEVRNTAQTTSGTGTGPDRDNTLAPAIGGKFVTADVSGSSIGQETRLLTPLVDITALTAPELEYYYHMHGTNMADLHVDIWDGTQWLLDQHLITGTQNISQSDPYNDTILDLSTYNIDTIQVRFRVTSNGCCSGDVAIDDIRISDPLSCNSPNNLSVTGVTSSDALFSWTPDPTAPGTDFVVSYGAGISSPTAGITAAVTGGTNFQLTALMPNTTYCAYVREVCAPGDSSFWSGPVCFTTACVPTTAPYFEDFELFTIGHFDGTEDCWSFEANNPGTTPSGNYSWEVRNTPQTTSTGTGPDRDHTLAPATGGVFITADVSGSSSGNDSVMLVSPLVDISSLTVPELSFWYHKFGVNMPDLNVDVWDGTWHRNVTTIAGVTQNASSDPYLRAAVDLTNFNDTVQVRFRVISLGCCQGDVAIDDVNFDESPACPDPTGLGVFNITGSSADIYWTSGSQTTSTTVQFGPVGFTPGTGTNVVTTNDTVTITGLALTTQYDVYIQDSCSNDTSKWIGPITFATPACLPGSACTHELMLYDTFGDGWNGAVITLFQAGSSAGSFGSAFTNGDTLGPISVQLCDGVPLDIVLTATGTFSNEIEYQLFDPDSNVIASHTATTGLVNGDTLSTAIAISCGSCPAPTAVSVSSITTNSASVSWTSGSTTTTSYIEYGPCGFTPGTGTIVSSISSPANLSGLMANTCYTACVYDICSTGDTSVAGCTNFNTQSVPCPSAGADNSGIVCDTLTAVDLSTYLDATANAGGTWVDASATGALTGSIFDPSVVGGQTGPVTYTFYYTVTATGCPTDSATISITVDTCSIGIDEFLAANLAIYPNPTSSVVYVEDLGIGTQTMTIEVYALNGQLLTSEVRDGNDRAVIDLSRFAKGMYNLKVTTDAGVVIRMISKQ